MLSRVEFQLTWCRGSDRTAASDSSCRGTPTYSFSPTIDWKLLLADERGSSGEPRATGEPIGPSHRMVCTAEIHHCVPVAFGDIKIGEGQAGNKFVALVVRARDPQAKPCRPATAANCDVLQLTPAEGRLAVVREQQASLTPTSSRNDKELASQLKVAGSKAEKKSFRKVIYSREFSKPGPILIKGRLDASFDRDLPLPPLVAISLVLADSATATTGSTIEPQNGENCAGGCSYLQPGLLICLTPEDITAGRRYLNLVGFAARESAFSNPSFAVNIEDGGYIETQQYDADLAPEACE